MSPGAVFAFFFSSPFYFILNTASVSLANEKQKVSIISVSLKIQDVQGSVKSTRRGRVFGRYYSMTPVRRHAGVRSASREERWGWTQLEAKLQVDQLWTCPCPCLENVTLVVSCKPIARFQSSTFLSFPCNATNCRRLRRRSLVHHTIPSGPLNVGRGGGES